jgi:hypothetical protein
MNDDTSNKTQQEKKLDTVEVVPVEQGVAPINNQISTDPEKEDLIVNNLALYFVSLARSISKVTQTGKSS